MAVATATTLTFIDIKQKKQPKMLNRLFWKLLKSTFLKIVEEKLAFYSLILRPKCVYRFHTVLFL